MDDGQHFQSLSQRSHRQQVGRDDQAQALFFGLLRTTMMIQSLYRSCCANLSRMGSADMRHGKKRHHRSSETNVPYMHALRNVPHIPGVPPP